MPLLITDPVDVRRDPVTGDVVVPMVHVAGLEGLAQRIGALLQLTRGEWFLGRTDGMPWVENDVVGEATAIIDHPFSDSRTRAEVRKVLTRFAEVSAVTSLTVTFDGDTREASVAWQVSTVWGVPLSGTTEVTIS